MTKEEFKEKLKAMNRKSELSGLVRVNDIKRADDYLEEAGNIWDVILKEIDRLYELNN